MCGIAGLYLKSSSMQPELGAHLAKMLRELRFRGPDSAGAAFYRAPAPDGYCKLSLYAGDGVDPAWSALGAAMAEHFGGVEPPIVRGGQATFELPADALQAQQWLAAHHPEVRVLSAGSLIETYKAAG